MNALPKGLCYFLAPVICAAVAGCGSGEKLVDVTGKVVEGGQPIALEGDEYKAGVASFTVTFHPLDADGDYLKGGQSQYASVQADGSFMMQGSEGKGIPAGKYRVSLRHKGPGQYSPRDPTQGDLLKGKFDVDNTPFTFDIQSDQEIVLDLTSPASPPGS